MAADRGHGRSWIRVRPATSTGSFCWRPDPGWKRWATLRISTSAAAFICSVTGSAEPTPTGPWADWFTIICWPITHAVLPTDLQRHLARLLFDFRRLLTADLLSNPDDLGLRLAAYAMKWFIHGSRRSLRTRLLGQVAAALLTGSGETNRRFSFEPRCRGS